MNEVEDVQPGHIYQPGNKKEVRLVYRILSGPYCGRHQKSFSLTKWGPAGAWEAARHAKAYMLHTGRLPPSFASPYSRSRLTNASANGVLPNSLDIPMVVEDQQFPISHSSESGKTNTTVCLASLDSEHHQALRSPSSPDQRRKQKAYSSLLPCGKKGQSSPKVKFSCSAADSSAAQAVAQTFMLLNRADVAQSTLAYGSSRSLSSSADTAVQSLKLLSEAMGSPLTAGRIIPVDSRGSGGLSQPPVVLDVTSLNSLPAASNYDNIYKKEGIACQKLGDSVADGRGSSVSGSDEATSRSKAMLLLGKLASSDACAISDSFLKLLQLQACQADTSHAVDGKSILQLQNRRVNGKGLCANKDVRSDKIVAPSPSENFRELSGKTIKRDEQVDLRVPFSSTYDAQLLNFPLRSLVVNSHITEEANFVERSRKVDENTHMFSSGVRASNTSSLSVSCNTGGYIGGKKKSITESCGMEVPSKKNPQVYSSDVHFQQSPNVAEYSKTSDTSDFCQVTDKNRLNNFSSENIFDAGKSGKITPLQPTPQQALCNALSSLVNLLNSEASQHHSLDGDTSSKGVGINVDAKQNVNLSHLECVNAVGRNFPVSLVELLGKRATDVQLKDTAVKNVVSGQLKILDENLDCKSSNRVEAEKKITIFLT